MTNFEKKIPEMHENVIRDLNDLAKPLAHDKKTEALFDRIVKTIDEVFAYAWDQAEKNVN